MYKAYSKPVIRKVRRKVVDNVGPTEFFQDEDQPYEYKGKLVEATGPNANVEPVEGVTMHYKDENGTDLDTAVTDVNGDFTLTIVAGDPMDDYNETVTYEGD